MLSKELIYDLKKIKNKNSKLLNNPIFLMDGNRLEELMFDLIFSVEEVENKRKLISLLNKEDKKCLIMNIS